MISRLRDVFDPVIRGQLNRLALVLKGMGYNVVSSLANRFLTWIDGNDRGRFVVDNYKTTGFYYINITAGTVATDKKITIHYQLKNLFTDEVAFQSTERFKAFPDARLETQNYYNAGYRFFQEQGNPANGHILPHWDSALTSNPNYKVMFVHASTQFNAQEVINQIVNGQPAPAIVPGTSTTGQTTTPVTTPTIKETLTNVVSKYPLYVVLGGGLVLYFLFRD